MKFIKNLLSKIPIKDLIFIGIIILLFFMFVFKGKGYSEKEVQNRIKVEKLQTEFKVRDSLINQFTITETNLKDSIEVLKNQKTKTDVKIKEVYKEVPIKYAIVDNLDVQHLQQFFAEWDYESDN